MALGLKLILVPTNASEVVGKRLPKAEMIASPN